MNAAASRSAARLSCRLTIRLSPPPPPLPPQSRCSSTVTYSPPQGFPAAPQQRPSPRQHEREKQERAARKTRPLLNTQKPRSYIVPDTIVPQLSQDEVATIYSQELFVFRCDVTATQIPAAMLSYKQLAEVGVLTPNDISNLLRQMHARYRIDQEKDDILPYLKTIIEDLKSGKIPGHPLASVHLLSCLKDMQAFETSNELWSWLIHQDENMCDARTYGAAIECLSYQGVMLSDLEAMWEQAVERYSATTLPSVAMNTGRGVPVMLLQGIITARLFHGNWRAAYEGFDICTRLYPTLTPPRIYELFIYERPVKEAYIVFLMACRAGSPPKPGVLTPLLKEIWLKTRDIRAMIRLVYAHAGAGGKPHAQHLNSLIGGILGSFPAELGPEDPEYKQLYDSTMSLVRKLIEAFIHMGVPMSPGSFNTIISIGGRLKRRELVTSGFRELLDAGLRPTMVTYRTLVNAVGDLKDADMLESSWEMLKAGRNELRVKWDFNDWKALIKACVATGRQDYFHTQLDLHKLDVGYAFCRNITAFMLRAMQPTQAPAADGVQAIQKRPTKKLLEKEVRMLTEIFSSNQIQDFTSFAPGESLFDLLPSEGTPSGVSVLPQHEKELRKIYKQLALPANIIDVENEGVGTKTSTGYDVELLRWENWKTVNRLLFEASWFERELERKKVEATIQATGGEDAIVGQKNKEKNIGFEFRFWNEDRAKEKLRGEVEGVVEARKTGQEGWKKREMAVRGQLGATLKGASGGRGEGEEDGTGRVEEEGDDGQGTAGRR